ncbi:HSP20-like chaperone [Gigaspora margarita]|uniref:HSP20-like chaperone n=1 Tax=Gigaspora margarita TaxID=4874 RepID=A0A8H3XDQ7_GIGMA|nr:HSP20-like chaperone [Gigaspora margarita]
MSVYWPDYKFSDFENSVSRLFDDFFKDLNVERQSGNNISRSSGSRTNWAPPLDVHESEKEYSVNAELPGVTKEQINLDVRENTLIISGETKKDEKYKEGNTHIQERRYGSFTHAISLPRNVKTGDITAKFENGILEVKLPKDENAAKKISIQ